MAMAITTFKKERKKKKKKEKEKEKTLKCSETIFHMGVCIPNPTQMKYSNHQGSVGIYEANILLTS